MIYMVNDQKQRFYWLALQQDLFETWCVRKIYRGLTNNHRREVWIPYQSRLDAATALGKTEHIRRQRGYSYVD